MPATVTLATTTLSEGVSASAGSIRVASTSGLTPGTRLWVDRELMSVVGLEVDPWVKVQRGVDGTRSSRHSASSLVTIGRADQFFQSDPQGAPPSEFSVSPVINVLTGDVFMAQGDTSSSEAQPVYRWWQKVTTTYGQGAMGIRTITQDPTAST